jgi:hypothetical protein
VIERMRHSMLNEGTVTERDVEEAIGLFADRVDPVSTYTPILVSARGRRQTLN